MTSPIQPDWSYAGHDDSGFEIEMKDTTPGENYHLIDMTGRVVTWGDGDSSNVPDANTNAAHVYDTAGTVSPHGHRAPSVISSRGSGP